MPNKATLEAMHTRGKYNPNISTKLIFREDNSFEFENMPDWWSRGFGGSLEGFQQVSGKWDLMKVGCCWQINLQMPNLVTSIGILEHRFGGSPKYVIERFLGDPDSGNKLIFIKQ